MTKKQLKAIKKTVYRQMLTSRDVQHCWNHIERVRKNALMITNKLNLNNKIDINLLQAITYLHDLCYSDNNTGIKTYLFEGKISKNKSIKILNSLKIFGLEREIILNAVSKHPHSFPWQKLNPNADIYTQIIQDADTLDFFAKKRVTDFQSIKRGFLFSRIIFFFSHWIIKYGKNNLYRYLNFPQLSKSI